METISQIFIHQIYFLGNFFAMFWFYFFLRSPKEKSAVGVAAVQNILKCRDYLAGGYCSELYPGSAQNKIERFAF